MKIIRLKVRRESIGFSFAIGFETMGKSPQNKLLALSLLMLLTVLSPDRPRANPTLGQGSIDQIRPLLPSQFEAQIVIPADPVALQLDSFTLRILSSPSGKDFCQAVPENEEWVRQAFFLRDESAKEAMGICRGHFSQKKINSRPHRKKFVLIKSDDDTVKVDGWTSNLNETFLFVQRTGFNQTRLIQAMIHEMAVSFDAKEGIGMLGKLDWPQLGLLETSEACTAVQIFRRGSIKHVLTAIRAFEVERKISIELNLPLPDGFADWSHLTCQQKFAFMQPFVAPLRPAIWAEELFNQMMDRPSCEVSESIRSQDPVAIETLSRLNLTWQNGDVRNACDFMMQGWPFLAGLSFRGGPGPRIGGGWSQLRATETDKARVLPKPINAEVSRIHDPFIPQGIDQTERLNPRLLIKEVENARKK